MKMISYRLWLLALLGMWTWSVACGQYAWQEDTDPEKLDLGKGINYQLEVQGSSANHETPLWLNANKYGLSSLDKQNGYARASVIRPLSNDFDRRWGIGYGVDVAVPVNYTSKVIVQQAFVEARWLHGVLSVGSKEYEMELKNNQLSSGSQALGINARPVPQVRIALPAYWTLPFGHDWLHLKGHIAYGKMTDDNWQHEFTGRKSKYADGVLYHSKAGYLMIGNPDRFYPLSLELGLEMACTFGGTAYAFHGDGSMIVRKGGVGFKDFWHAFVPGGGDVGEGQYANIAGDQLGSWVARLNYEADMWKFHLYLDHFFEDHSQMLHIDYDGYGSGEEWNVKKDRRFLLYHFKDFMLGGELELKYGSWLRGIVLEYIHTKDQSGPINHDRTKGISDHVAGIDNYYNHYILTGWQHWGQVIGNPLYRSPIYNTDGTIEVKNNRFKAVYLGVNGSPTEKLDYRVLASYQEGFGTYSDAYTHKRHNVSFMTEVTCHLPRKWSVRGAYGMDFGSILGHNAGFQLTISKKGIFNL